MQAQRITKRLTAILAGAAALGGAIGPLRLAHARSQAAFLGYPNSSSSPACFAEELGAVRQKCSSRQTWSMPMVYDNAGWMNVRVTYAANGAADPVFCQAFSADAFGDVRHGSQAIGRSSGPLDSTVFAQGFGQTWMVCNLPSETKLFNVHY